jgi:peptide/nickel transport system substrate-binding protein
VREAVDVAPAFQILPPGIVGHVPELAAAAVPDRERARRLLAAAGYASGLTFRLDGPNNRYVRDEAILHDVAEQLADVGIRAEARATDKAEFFRMIERGGSVAHLLGWASETGDGGDALDILFHPPTDGSAGRLNSTGLRDAELNRMITAVHSSPDLRQRAQRLRRAFERVAELRPIVPLVIQTEAVVHSRRLVWDAPVSRALRPLDFRPAP